MKTTVITTALLALTMFAGCSKDETNELNAGGSNQITSTPYYSKTIVGDWRVISYSADGENNSDYMSNMKIRFRKEGVVETILGDEHAKGTYTYGVRNSLLRYVIEGTDQTKLLNDHTWKVTTMPNLQLEMVSEDEFHRIVVTKIRDFDTNPM